MVWPTMKTGLETQMSKTECPYCHQPVSYWAKLKPAFQLTQQFILCPHCRKKVSSFWIRGAIGAGLSGGFLGYQIGKDENVPVQAAAVIGLFVLSMMIMPFFIDLKESDTENIQNIRAQMMAKELSYSWARILKIVGITVGFFIFLIWISQPSGA